MRYAIAQLLCVCTLWAAAAQGPCDPNLQVAPSDPLGYRLRGDRCEGRILEKVGGALQLASLHFRPRTFTPGPETVVTLSWSLPAQAPVRIRAVSLKPETYYRMDTGRPEGSSTYPWPTQFLQAARLTADEIGIVAWVEIPLGNSVLQVFSPVSVDGGSGELEAIVLPDAQLDEIWYSLVKLDERGRERGYVFSDRKLPSGYRPRRQPVTLLLARVEQPGYFRLEVAATTRRGAPATRDVYFWSGEK